MSVTNLRQSRQKAVVAFTNFTRLYKRNSSLLYCFFEGEDSKYYGVRIDNIVRSREASYLSCKGKEGVIGVQRMLSQRKHYSNAWTAYFIDRDFDESVHDKGQLDKIHETPCYSIENFYTSLSCVSKILKSEFKMLESDQDYLDVLSLYQKLQIDFHDAIELLNAWIYVQRSRKDSLNISGTKLSKFVSIDLKGVTQIYSIQNLRQDFPSSKAISSEEIEEAKRVLISRRRQTSFRGKFELEFLVSFLQAVIHEANLGNPCYFSKKTKVPLNISLRNAISSLSQYADTPDCLHKYLSSFNTDVS